MDVLYNEFGDSKYRAHPLLKKDGKRRILRKKNWKRFFDYSKINSIDEF